MHLFLTKEELRKAGKVFCEDCQHFESGSTPGGLGFCALTKNDRRGWKKPVKPFRTARDCRPTQPQNWVAPRVILWHPECALNFGIKRQQPRYNVCRTVGDV
jgi:hypothetical protein